jgi:WD40 repeat protein
MPITFSPNSRLLATSDIDRSVKLWNATTGARIITLQGHQDDVKALAFSPDSRMLASSSADYQVRLWNLQTYQVQRTLDAATGVSQSVQNPGHLDFTADGRILATSAIRFHPVHSQPLLTPGATLWNVATGQPLTTVDSVNAFNFSPNSQFLLTHGSTLQVWQP